MGLFLVPFSKGKASLQEEWCLPVTGEQQPHTHVHLYVVTHFHFIWTIEKSDLLLFLKMVITTKEPGTSSEFPGEWQGPQAMGHHHCLPECALAGGWVGSIGAPTRREAGTLMPMLVAEVESAVQPFPCCSQVFKLVMEWRTPWVPKISVSVQCISEDGGEETEQEGKPAATLRTSERESSPFLIFYMLCGKVFDGPSGCLLLISNHARELQKDPGEMELKIFIWA